jgi:hypothetical protein
VNTEQVGVFVETATEKNPRTRTANLLNPVIGS